MPTKLVVLPISRSGSGEVDTLGLNLKVVEVKASYQTVAKVVVEGSANEINKIGPAFDAWNAAALAAYQDAKDAKDARDAEEAGGDS